MALRLHIAQRALQSTPFRGSNCMPKTKSSSVLAGAAAVGALTFGLAASPPARATTTLNTLHGFCGHDDRFAVRRVWLRRQRDHVHEHQCELQSVRVHPEPR